MSSMEFDPRSVSDRDSEMLATLACSAPFAPLRWLDRFAESVSIRHRSDHVAAALRSDPSPLTLRDGDDLVGALLWRGIPDLEDHFDVSVHEVTSLLVAPDADRQVVIAALLDGLREVTNGDHGFVMLRIEADDIVGLCAATRAGFELRETSLSFVNDLERRHLNLPYDPSGMQVHRFDDGPLPDALRSIFRAFPTRLVGDHYHADPRLDPLRCDALYDRLRDRVVDGIGADVLVYHEDDGDVTGFGTFKRAADVEPYGVSLLNGAIGFQRPGAPRGQSNTSASFMCGENLLNNRLIEWGTQATNFRMVNMLGGHRSVRLCRASHVLHCWNDVA